MSMAGDAHPVDGGSDDGAVTSARDETGAAGRAGVTVDGNPTARELTAVLAAVDAARRFPATGGGADEPTGSAATGSEGGPGTADAADGGGEPGDGGSSNSRERVAHERRCPVCRERYDSTRPLEGATSVRTAERGASTVCVDPGSERAYVHSPPPR